MSDLINGKTLEDIKDALTRCGRRHCKAKDGDCPYYVDCLVGATRLKLMKDAFDYIQYLESERDAALAKVPKWISVKERLPENGELVLITMDGAINGSKLFNQAYELACYYRDGEDEEGEHHIEGWELWDYREGEVKNLKVYYWMPMPKAPEEEG